MLAKDENVINKLERMNKAIEYIEELRVELLKNTISFAVIGFLLKFANVYLKDIPNSNYKNVYDFAKSELHLCKSTVKYYIGIHSAFCDGRKVKEDYVDYNYSQLREMYTLSEEQLKLVTPTMTCEDIKRLKKTIKKEEDATEQQLINAFNLQDFKNKEERLKFLKDYTKWQLFKEVPEFNLKFYRAKMSNGTYIIATQSEVGKSLILDDYYFNCIRTIVNYCVLSETIPTSRYDINGSGGISAIEKYMSAYKLKYVRD